MREPRLHISASFGLPVQRELEPPARFPAIAGLIVAALVVTASATGLGDPAMYAQETASWRAQAMGQDLLDLVVAVPWLIIAASATLRGSRRAQFVLASGLAYTAYSFAVYAFAVRFNQMFLVYCAILGLSAYGLISLAALFTRKDLRDRFADRAPRRVASVMLIATASAFALMWLGEDIPAVIRGEQPATLVEVGLATNPIHVLDLSIVLPAVFASGVLLWRRRTQGYVLATIAMGFCVLMDLNIAGIVIAMQLLAVATELTTAWVFVAAAAFAAALLVLLLRPPRSQVRQVTPVVRPSSRTLRGAGSS